MLWDSATRGVKVNMAIAGPAIVILGLIVAWSAIYSSEKFDRIVRGGMKCSWWNSTDRTLTLEERKLKSYVAELLCFARKRTTRGGEWCRR